MRNAKRVNLIHANTTNPATTSPGRVSRLSSEDPLLFADLKRKATTIFTKAHEPLIKKDREGSESEIDDKHDSICSQLDLVFNKSLMKRLN